MILEKIAESTRERVEAAKNQIPLSILRARICDMELDTGFPFEEAFKKKGDELYMRGKEGIPI